jgi:hypothetical protein
LNLRLFDCRLRLFDCRTVEKEQVSAMYFTNVPCDIALGGQI